MPLGLADLSDANFQADLYLASRSPRRRELLQQIGVRYELLDVEVDESRLDGEHPLDYVVRVARLKASAGLNALGGGQNLPVLGADTAVVLNDQVFGKPRDEAHAHDMLMALSDREHQVVSVVALAGAEANGNAHCLHIRQVSHVRFHKLSSRMIAAYWRSGEPADKAGAYAIQGLAAGFVADLKGSFSGVMGLPLHETLQLMAEFGVREFKQSHGYLERLAGE